MMNSLKYYQARLIVKEFKLSNLIKAQKAYYNQDSDSIESENEIEWLEIEIRDKKEEIKQINFEIMMLKLNNLSLK